MLFEVVASARPTGISGDEHMRRLPEAVAYMKKLKEDGVILHSWVRVGRYGATTIFDVSSHEALLGYLNGNPLVPHVAYEVIPLASTDDFDGSS
jgi:muconolactone delta-isomerase